MGSGSNVQFKHPSSGVDVWEWDVDTFFESGISIRRDGVEKLLRRQECDERPLDNKLVTWSEEPIAVLPSDSEIETRSGGKMKETEEIKRGAQSERDTPSLDSRIQLPRNIRSPKNKYSSIIISDTVNLSSVQYSNTQSRWDIPAPRTLSLSSY